MCPRNESLKKGISSLEQLFYLQFLMVSLPSGSCDIKRLCDVQARKMQSEIW